MLMHNYYYYYYHKSYALYVNAANEAKQTSAVAMIFSNVT